MVYKLILFLYNALQNENMKWIKVWNQLMMNLEYVVGGMCNSSMNLN